MDANVEPFICGAGSIASDSIRLNTVLKEVDLLITEVEFVHKITENIYDEFKKMFGYLSEETDPSESIHKTTEKGAIPERSNENSQFNRLSEVSTESNFDMIDDQENLDEEMTEFLKSGFDEEILEKMEIPKFPKDDTKSSSSKSMFSDSRSKNQTRTDFQKKINSTTKPSKRKKKLFDRQKKAKLDKLIRSINTRNKTIKDTISQMLAENYNFTEQLFRQSYTRPRYTDSGVGNRVDLNFNTSNASVFYSKEEYSAASNS